MKKQVIKAKGFRDFFFVPFVSFVVRIFLFPVRPGYGAIPDGLGHFVEVFDGDAFGGIDLGYAF